MAHQGGGGLGGFFDFAEAARAWGGVFELVGEDVGVGGDHAEKIVESVGDDLIFGRRENGGAGGIESERHLRAFLNV